MNTPDIHSSDMSDISSSFSGIVSISLAMALFSPALCAADEVVRIEPVYVSAARSLQSSVPIPAAITIINEEEIAASGAQRITEVLRGRGGLQLRDFYGDGSRSVVSLRGFGENAAANTLILVDGRRLNNTDLGAPDLNSISLNDVERIEIIHGSAGVLFGDQAVGGVINVVTRTPRDFRAEIAAGLGSFSEQTWRGSVTDRADNGLGYRFSAETRDSDNYRDNNRQEYSNLFGRLDYSYSDRGSAFMEYQSIDEDLRLPGAIFADQVEDDRTQTRFPNDFTDSESRISRLGVRQRLHDTWQVEAELSNRRSDGEGVLTGSSFTQDRDYTAFTPRLIGTLPMSAGEILLTVGADVDRNDYTITSLFGSTDNRQKQRALYAQGTIPLDEALSATLGMRHAKVENDLTDSFSFPDGVELDDSASVTSLGLSYTVATDWRLFARRDEVLRFPKVDEYTFIDTGITELKTQTGASNEFGVEWRRDAHAARAILYRLNLDNEIDFDPSASSGFGGNTNLEPTRRTGLIIDGNAQPTPALRIGGAYGYVDAEFDSGSFSGNRIPFVAEQTFSLNANYRLATAWSVFGECQYISSRVPQGDYANTLEKLPGYSVYNAAIDYHAAPWKLTLRVDNLTDKRYSDIAARDFNPFPVEVTAYYPAPERAAHLSMAYQFE